MIDFNQLWGAADWIVLLLYFVGVMIVGFVMHRKASKSFKSFFVASRRLTIPVLIGTAAASWYDSWTIVGLAECGATIGISVILVYIIPSTILRLPLALWIGPMTRSKMPDWVVTLPDLFRYFYNKPTGLLSAICPMSSQLYCCALLFAVGEVLNLVSGMNIWLAMIIAGFAIVVYTFLAGMWGLAVTDLIQFMIMTVSAAALLVGIYNNFGSASAMFEASKAIDPELTQLFGHMTGPEAFGWIISALAIYTNAQSYQRFGAAKGGGEIKIAYPLMLAIGGIFSATMVLAGVASITMFPGAETPAQGFWAMVFSVLPTGCRGLFVAALIAAVMSTVSAEFLITGGILVKDFFKGLVKPDLSDLGVLKGTRGVICFLGVFVICGTYLWQNGIANAWNIIGGFQVAVFLIPLLGGFFYKNKSAVGGLVTVIFNVLWYILWQFILGAPMGIPSSVSTWVAGLIVYFIACSLFKDKDSAEKNLLS
ncbi:MAG: sodium:solute symporter family protein [Firmicutes bacterium]|nr:sodium:solute symporter family protein [Bacillota bacterium]